MGHPDPDTDLAAALHPIQLMGQLLLWVGLGSAILTAIYAPARDRTGLITVGLAVMSLGILWLCCAFGLKRRKLWAWDMSLAMCVLSVLITIGLALLPLFRRTDPRMALLGSACWIVALGSMIFSLRTVRRLLIVEQVENRFDVLPARPAIPLDPAETSGDDAATGYSNESLRGK